MGHYLQNITFLNTESTEEIISGHISTQTVSSLGGKEKNPKQTHLQLWVMLL